MDKKPVNFTTIGGFLHIPAQTIYVWYRNYLSGYPEAVVSKQWGKDNFMGSDKQEKKVPVLKEENFGKEMSVDEKMIADEYYTVMTNRETGKIALLAETMQVKDLNKLIDKIPSVKNIVKPSQQTLVLLMKIFVNKVFQQQSLLQISSMLLNMF